LQGSENGRVVTIEEISSDDKKKNNIFVTCSKLLQHNRVDKLD